MTLHIEFIGCNDYVEIENGKWTDWDLKDGFVHVINGRTTVAIYNAKEVFSVTIN